MLRRMSRITLMIKSTAPIDTVSPSTRPSGKAGNKQSNKQMIVRERSLTNRQAGR